MDGSSVELTLWDNAGEQEYPTLRSLSYYKSNVILLCYEAELPRRKLKKTLATWIHDISERCPSVPIILVGVISPSQDVEDETPLLTPRPELMRGVSKQGPIVGCLNCSPRTGAGVDAIFAAVCELPHSNSAFARTNGSLVRPPVLPWIMCPRGRAQITVGSYRVSTADISK